MFLEQVYMLGTNTCMLSGNKIINYKIANMTRGYGDSFQITSRVFGNYYN